MEHKQIDEYEKSITVKYRAKIWSKFVAGIKQYKLVEPNDHICVCISGGKDSMLMARLFMQLTKHSDFDFKVSYLVMNPGYNEINLQTIKNNLVGYDLDIINNILTKYGFDINTRSENIPYNVFVEIANELC